MRLLGLQHMLLKFLGRISWDSGNSGTNLLTLSFKSLSNFCKTPCGYSLLPYLCPCTQPYLHVEQPTPLQPSWPLTWISSLWSIPSHHTFLHLLCSLHLLSADLIQTRYSPLQVSLLSSPYDKITQRTILSLIIIIHLQFYWPVISYETKYIHCKWSHLPFTYFYMVLLIVGWNFSECSFCLSWCKIKTFYRVSPEAIHKNKTYKHHNLNFHECVRANLIYWCTCYKRKRTDLDHFIILIDNFVILLQVDTHPAIHPSIITFSQLYPSTAN